jgi:hypothetical protein
MESSLDMFHEGAMETANLTFRMTHPSPSDLDAATALARAIVDHVSAATPR